MSDANKIERFDIATKDKTPLEIWVSLKEFFRKVAESQGKKLDESWDQDEKFANSRDPEK